MTVESYLAIEKNKLLIHTIVCMYLKCMLLNERRQTPSMIPSPNLTQPLTPAHSMHFYF